MSAGRPEKRIAGRIMVVGRIVMEYGTGRPV
jgi:hypothetical protein